MKWLLTGIGYMREEQGEHVPLLMKVEKKVKNCPLCSTQQFWRLPVRKIVLHILLCLHILFLLLVT